MERFDVNTATEVMILMRDGVRMATDIYFPAVGGLRAPGTYPVLLERTPYDRTDDKAAKRCRYFARRGYVAVIQDVRGHFDSEGEVDPFGEADVNDGFDTCAWINSQPWFGGKIGTLGTSYAAMNQSGLAMSGPPGLASQFYQQGFGDNYGGRIRQGGALRQTMVAWIFGMAAKSRPALQSKALRAQLDEINAGVQEWIAQPTYQIGQTPLRMLPDYERHMINIATRADLDDWWLRPGRHVNWDTFPDNPIYLLGCWYDSHAHVTSWAYQELRKRLTSPVRLIFGPWVHGSLTPGEPIAGSAHFGVEAAIEIDDLKLAWFDQTLRGLDADVPSAAPVRIFVMGGGSGRQVRYAESTAISVGGKWRDEQEWPLARTEYTPYYFHGTGLLTILPGTDSTQRSTTYRYDPNDPVPTVGGPLSSINKLRVEAGAFDQRALYSRPDVISFQTPPLDQGIEVTGPIEAVLYVSSTAPDTDFTVKLVDVWPPNEDFPDGMALNISDGIMRARYRSSWTQPEWLEPGQVVELRVMLPPTSLWFAPGHQIRIDISSSNWPRFDANPNTAEPLGRNLRREPADNTIYHSATHQSHVVLPVIPARVPS